MSFDNLTEIANRGDTSTPPPGDTHTERTVQIVSSDQIEAAKQSVNEVISEDVMRAILLFLVHNPRIFITALVIHKLPPPISLPYISLVKSEDADSAVAALWNEQLGEDGLLLEYLSVIPLDHYESFEKSNGQWRWIFTARATLGRLLPHARGLGFKSHRGGFPSGAKK
uniref:Uncharacterized protein n=1 Tax=Tanacetum cinerariifolium TaxID=118510 RepID=A0A6L2L472_TANCI|nr:hypothetical protein [Tanacetum cinerariifolium]